MGNLLSTDLHSPASIPYFLWDEPMTVAELRTKLALASDDERLIRFGEDIVPPGDVSLMELQVYLNDLLTRLSRMAFPN